MGLFMQPCRLTLKYVVPLVAVMVGAGGCSFEFSLGETHASVAEDLIEGELADEIGQTGIEATCDKPVDTEPGTIFNCTSPSDLGEIRWVATVEDEESVYVITENLMTESDLVAMEEGAISALQDVGLQVTGEDIDCGSAPALLTAGDVLLCALTDQSNGDVYDTKLTITDKEEGLFDIDVADNPRAG